MLWLFVIRRRFVEGIDHTETHRENLRQMLCQLRKDPMDEDLEKCDGEYFPCEFCGDPYPVEFIMRHQVSCGIINAVHVGKEKNAFLCFSCLATSIQRPFKKAVDSTIQKSPEGLQPTWLWQETSFQHAQKSWTELLLSPRRSSPPSLLK